MEAFSQTVVLQRDLGLGFRVVWRDSGLPVEQAVVELTRVLRHSPWLLDAVRESSLCRTDGAGVARLYGIWNEDSRSSVVVRHTEAVSTIVDIGSWIRSGETQSLLIELIRETTCRFRIVDEFDRGVANTPVSMFVGDHEISTQSDNLGYVEPQYAIRFRDVNGAQ